MKSLSRLELRWQEPFPPIFVPTMAPRLRHASQNLTRPAETHAETSIREFGRARDGRRWRQKTALLRPRNATFRCNKPMTAAQDGPGAARHGLSLFANVRDVYIRAIMPPRVTLEQPGPMRGEVPQVICAVAGRAKSMAAEREPCLIPVSRAP